MFERDQRGLRGPVKSCTEETTCPSVTDGQGKTYPEVHSEFTTEYDSDGRVLATRSSNTRNPGGQWVSFYEYDASGLLLKVASGVEGKTLTETIYSYDQHAVANRVAEARKEGFMGLSGERVSEPEHQALDAITKALEAGTTPSE